MITTEKRPPALILSGAPAWFQIKNTGDNKKVICSVKVGGQTIATCHAFASFDDFAFFELSEFFKTNLIYEYSGASGQGSVLRIITSHIKREFTIDFECDNESPSSQQEIIHVVLGELTQDFIFKSGYGKSPNTTIYDYLANNPLLTIKPEIINIYYKEQPEYLYLLSPQGIGTVYMTLQVLHADGVGYSIMLGSLGGAANSLYEIDCSYINTVQPRLNHLQADNPVTMYKIILSTGGHTIFKEYTYNVKFSHKATGSFLFVNSLGGRDTFCPMGSLEILSDISSSFQKILTSPYVEQDQHSRSKHSPGHTFSQNTGFITYENMVWLSQLIYSKNVTWRNTDNTQTPISIISNKISARNVRAKLYNADIQYIINPNYKAEQQ